MKVKVFYNEKENRYLHNLLKNNIVDGVRKPEEGKYWKMNDSTRRQNFKKYYETWGEMLASKGYLPVEIDIKVEED